MTRLFFAMGCSVAIAATQVSAVGQVVGTPVLVTPNQSGSLWYGETALGVSAIPGSSGHELAVAFNAVNYSDGRVIMQYSISMNGGLTRVPAQELTTNGQCETPNSPTSFDPMVAESSTGAIYLGGIMYTRVIGQTEATRATTFVQRKPLGMAFLDFVAVARCHDYLIWPQPVDRGSWQSGLLGRAPHPRRSL